MNDAAIYWFLDGLCRNVQSPSPRSLANLCHLLNQTTTKIWPALAQVGVRPHPDWQKAFTHAHGIHGDVLKILSHSGLEPKCLPRQKNNLVNNQLCRVISAAGTNACPAHVVLGGLSGNLPTVFSRLCGLRTVWLAAARDMPPAARTCVHRIISLAELGRSGAEGLLPQTLLLWDIENFIPVTRDMPHVALQDLRVIVNCLLRWLRAEAGYDISPWSIATIRKGAPFEEELTRTLVTFGLRLQSPGSTEDPAEVKLERHVRNLVIGHPHRLPGHAVVLSGDGDLLSTVCFLQRAGCKVMGISWRHHASQLLREKCDTFHSLETILGDKILRSINTRPYLRYLPL